MAIILPFPRRPRLPAHVRDRLRADSLMAVLCDDQPGVPVPPALRRLSDRLLDQTLRSLTCEGDRGAE